MKAANEKNAEPVCPACKDDPMELAKGWLSGELKPPSR
jgi:hypothetical protein